MPIFEYKCKKCGEVFEAFLASPKQKPKCPKCGSASLEKLISTFSAPAPKKDARECGHSGGHHCCGEGCRCHN